MRFFDKKFSTGNPKSGNRFFARLCGRSTAKDSPVEEEGKDKDRQFWTCTDNIDRKIRLIREAYGSSYFLQINDLKVETSLKNKSHEVRSLRTALVDGDESQTRPSLPTDVVEKILMMADYHCLVVTKSFSGFKGENRTNRLFSFGPLPAKPAKVEILVTVTKPVLFTSQGICTTSLVGHVCIRIAVDVLDKEGKSKTNGMLTIFTNDHFNYHINQTDFVKFEESESFLEMVTKEDTLVLYSCADLHGQRIELSDARMSVWLNPTNTKTLNYTQN